MSVEALPESRLHPADEMLEEYCLGRVQHPVLGRVEDHLLVCADCCTRVAEVDAYLDLMKAGLASIEEEQCTDTWAFRGAADLPSGIRRKPWAFSIGDPFPASFPKWASVREFAAVAVLVFSATLARRTRGGRSRMAGLTEREVSLVAMLGGTADAVSHSKAGVPLKLNFDRTSLRDSPGYRVVVVDASGREAWNGPIADSGEHLSVQVRRGLGPGAYWVRLYAEPSPAPAESANGASGHGELLREFGLRLE
jgi:hypothetical protein